MIPRIFHVLDTFTDIYLTICLLITHARAVTAQLMYQGDFCETCARNSFEHTQRSHTFLEGKSTVMYVATKLMNLTDRHYSTIKNGVEVGGLVVWRFGTWVAMIWSSISIPYICNWASRFEIQVRWIECRVHSCCTTFASCRQSPRAAFIIVIQSRF